MLRETSDLGRSVQTANENVGFANLTRRQFLIASASAVASPVTGQTVTGQTASVEDRLGGMLAGSLIGDALGGPFEFAETEKVRPLLPDVRRWGAERRLDSATIEQLAGDLKMHGYAELRPQPAPYGPWRESAPAGTLTDDSRHKLILIRALRKWAAEDTRVPLSVNDLAHQIIDFRIRDADSTGGNLDDRNVSPLLQEGLREYRFAAQWVLGERDPSLALPLERLWSGVANCSGQMMLIPLAGLFPGDPEKAYRETYRLDFVDAPMARDFAAALNAGLAAALDPELDRAEDEIRWQALLTAIREVDPWRIREVPYVGRPLDRWLELADSIVRRADGRPAEAFRLLETEGQPVYYWDAHFTLLVPITLLRLCRFDALAALQLVLDFGHDTDSYAQVLGAMAGAVAGRDMFPAGMIERVDVALRRDFGESLENWVKTIRQSRKHYRELA